MASELHDGVHRVLDGGVPERKLCDIDAIVDAASWWVGEVHGEPPFPGALLGNGTQQADYEIGKGWDWEGSGGVARNAFLVEVLINYVWVCKCGLQVWSLVFCLWARVAHGKSELQTSRQVVNKVGVGVMREQGCESVYVDGGDNKGWWWWVGGGSGTAGQG